MDTAELVGKSTAIVGVGPMSLTIDTEFINQLYRSQESYLGLLGVGSAPREGVSFYANETPNPGRPPTLKVTYSLPRAR
jgi:hypothetical protein